MTDVRSLFVIGRNYAKAGEKPATGDPVVTLKPISSLVWPGTPLQLPPFSREVHHEIELTVLIGKRTRNVSERDALAAVAGYSVGLDVTAFDLQQDAKANGLPWTVCKGFDTAGALAPFVTPEEAGDPSALTFALDVNGERRQSGDASMMTHSFARIISYMSTVFTLDRGDVIYTGTPAGARAMMPGDELVLHFNGTERGRFTVAS